MKRKATAPFDIDNTEENEDWILTPERRVEEIAISEKLAEEYKKAKAIEEEEIGNV